MHRYEIVMERGIAPPLMNDLRLAGYDHTIR